MSHWPLAAVFMKVGVHAAEGLEEIISRKLKEQQDAGVLYWGYGGVVCHPILQVQQFVKEARVAKREPWLVMSITRSKFLGTESLAKEFSSSGDEWRLLPNGVKVKGSKFALVCNDLEYWEHELDLSKYAVAVGPSRKKRLSEYLNYRVDKACAFWDDTERDLPRKPFKAFLRARLVAPYAVILR